MRHYLLSLLLVGLLATPGWAAPTLDANSGGTGTNSTSHSHTLASAANLILVLVKTSDGGNVNSSITSVTVGGTGATLVCSKTINNQHRSEIYSLLSPATGAQTVAVTANAAVDFTSTISVSLIGAAATNTFNTCGTASNAGSTNVDIDSLASAVGELAIMTLGDNDGGTCSADATAPTSTEIREQNLAPNTTNCAYYEAGAAGTIDMRVDLSGSSAWVASAVSVRPATSHGSAIILQ